MWCSSSLLFISSAAFGAQLAIARPMPRQAATPATGPRLERIALLETAGKDAEIVSVQASSRRAIVVHSALGLVELVDLATPEEPHILRAFDLTLAEGEGLTSAAVHPGEPWFLAAIEARGALERGRIEVRSLADGARLAAFEAGVGPDCVGIDPSGRYALSANEAEEFERSPEGELRSAAGSLTWIRFAEDLASSEVRQLELPSLAGVEDAFSADDGRFLEREVGDVEHAIPLLPTPEYLEPEVVAFSPDGTLAFVTLQENNAVLRLDVGKGEIETFFGLGKTSHPADLEEDKDYRPDETLVALREPDGIAVTRDGRYFVTADEGDTRPQAKKTLEGLPGPGGRTVSVFDAATGELLGDTGAELDERAAAAGLYPDKRSGEKGSEPEMIVAFELDGHAYAAVGLERAGALALIDLADPRAPRVVDLAPVGLKPAKDAPEGVAHYRDLESGVDYLLTANEGSGTLSIFRVRPSP